MPTPSIPFGDVGRILYPPRVVDWRGRAIDLTGASTVEVLVTRESGASSTWSADLDNAPDGRVSYVTGAGDLDEAGVWTIQAHAILPDGSEYHGPIGDFEVAANLEGGAGVGTGMTSHAYRHAAGGADELDAADLSSGAATDGYVLTADGAGGAAWEAAAGGGGGGGPHAATHATGGGDAITPAAIGAAAAADLSAHTADTANPHAVTAAQVGAATPADLAAHTGNTANPHGTDVGNLGAGTLAELNLAITDATLDDSSASRTPSAHAASHASGGGDPITPAAIGAATAAALAAHEGAANPHTITPAGIGAAPAADLAAHEADVANPHGVTIAQIGAAAAAHSHADAVASGAAGFLSGADKAKLDGVEAGADVTDAVNVAAAGALMSGAAAGGDLGGTLPSPTVTQLQGRPLLATAPASGEVIAWNGSAWAPWVPSGGGGSSPTVDVIGGFRASDPSVDHYEAAAGVGIGVAGQFTASVMARPHLLRTPGYGTRIMIGAYRRFIGGGWALGMDETRPKIFLTQASDGSKLENFTGPEWPTFGAGRFVILTFTWNGTTATLYVNGEPAATLTPTGGIQFEASVGLAWGCESYGGNWPFDGEIAGAAYTGAAGFSANEVLFHALACLDADAMVDGGPGFANLWTAPSGSAPATITDAIGADDLTRTGAPTSGSRRVHWLEGGIA